jgi:fibronectin type 3 domain-containing protein
MHQAVLTWTPSIDTVSGYNIYRGTASGQESKTKINSALVTGTTYTDTTVLAGITYFYEVTSVNAAGNESADSLEVSGTVPFAPPTGLKVVMS